MEPFSIWAFTAIAAAVGVGLSLTGKKPAKVDSVEPVGRKAAQPAAVTRTTRPQAPVPVERADNAPVVIDVEKEKAIDALIANQD
ncbi:MAG: hypothetical protein HQL20_03650 [Candidatus Omnitrophica bacterium]|nr:hypothetical protein [Candidatus Omnitrophota bacterium]